MTIKPPDNTPEYLWPAWAGCVRWALTEPHVVEAFRADTGNKWEPGRTPIDRMIDEATGAEREFIETFVAWVNENIWGDPFADDEASQ